MSSGSESEYDGSSASSAASSLTGSAASDSREGSPSLRVVDAVAAAEDVDPAAIDVPLYEAVDPEALDALFGARGTSNVCGHVAFTYCGYEVSVTADGDVSLVRIDQ